MNKQPAKGSSQPLSPLPEVDIMAFRATVYATSRANPRQLPWRDTTDPYRIMVSEIMLQQTQAERVTGKFIEFVGQFPDVAALAAADFSEVLRLWQGLGYNRRALALKRAAEMVVNRFDGTLPVNRKELVSLPGIGPYTAGAIMAFAFDLPETFIETNIRSVYIHHFFQDRRGIHDRELLPLVEVTMDRCRPREWYNALMDYGVVLKRQEVNPSRKSAHHLRQTPFAGSNRQMRSALLRAILAHPGIAVADLTSRVSGEEGKVVLNLAKMVEEGLITCTGENYFVS
ncbi:MAG TPA: A/G-specific adenine glycosylase [Geobacteraceae bacterium]|nr:A/G-specific adenine glycosylase [Geobacteraceae bacterium]